MVHAQHLRFCSEYRQPMPKMLDLQTAYNSCGSKSQKGLRGQNFIPTFGTNSKKIHSMMGNLKPGFHGQFLCQVLETRKVWIDDFFALGGDSMSAVNLFLSIEESFGVKLPISILLQAGNIEKQISDMRNNLPDLIFQ